MIKRKLGNTGDSLSILGFGGILVKGELQENANKLVHNALDLGINYFDVAPSYGDAQDKLGPALEGHRNGIFLACKTAKRTKAEAEAELSNSLKILKTGHFDLYQFHGVSTMADVETIFGPDGAMEVFVKARRDGLIRHIGFSAHNEEAAAAMMDRFDFVSVLFPVNWVCMLRDSFGHRILKKAQEKCVARLALKAMACTKWPSGSERKYPKCWYQPVDDQELASLALRYTLSQPVTAAIPPGDARFFENAAKTAANFTPVTETEIEGLKIKAADMLPIF